MSRISITDATDGRISDYTGLTEVALRSSTEAANGLFIAEGEKVIRRALAAGYAPRSVLSEAKWLQALEPLLPEGTPVFEAQPEVLAGVTGYRVHRGALAAMNRRPLPSMSEVLAGATRIVVLEDLVDHTNVGAIFRNAAALGIDAAILSPACADPLYRRSVKVSMGTVFSLPWTRASEWPGGIDELRDLGFEVLALTPGGEVDLRGLGRLGRAALMLGTEGDGLTAPALAAADRRVRITMREGIDSLNVAAASAVAFYAISAACGP